MHKRLNALRIHSVIVTATLLLALPTLVIAYYLGQENNENWQHLVDHLLGQYTLNSLLLMVGVSAGVLSMGIIPAWLTSMCRFPGSQTLAWALLLPLAIPAYIIAYTYTGLLDFSGPVQSLIRTSFNLNYGEYWFPNIRTIPGAVLMLSLVLFPYVYMLTRAAFLEQSICVLEVSRTLGNNAYSSFYRVALPLARPAIITGLSLALMETLADFGTVEYFSIPTFTTGIFKAWFGMGDNATASKLAALLLVFVVCLIALERRSRQKARYAHTSNKYSTIKPYQLRGWRAALAFTACFLPVLFGFLVPAGQLLFWALTTAESTWDSDFFWLVIHSLSLAASAASIAVAFALVLAYGKRLMPTLIVRSSVGIASMGYAIPGTVIAVGVMIPLAWFDNTLDAWLRASFQISTGLLLSGTLFALLFAYTVRFLSVSIQAIDAGLSKVKPSMDNAGRSLGFSPLEVLRKIHLPLMRSTVITAFLLVFVDVLKELPATLILRPFNFNTLAVKAHELAADERLADAGTPALMIVLTGLIPILILNKAISHSRAGSDTADKQP